MSGSTNGKVSIVITGHNALPWLGPCFESLRRQTYRNFEILFVDNNSSDDSVAFIEQHYPETRIIRNHRDEGFASANNIGARAASGEYILLLSTDTTASETLLEYLLQAFKEIPRLGCVQPKLYFLHDPRRLDSCGSYFTWTGFLRHIGSQQRSDAPEYNRAFPVLNVKGACMMFRKEFLEKTGGLFDDDYYCYFEETDFCMRVWLAGLECWYYPTASIHHAMGGVVGLQIPTVKIQFHSFTNRLMTYLKNLSTGSLLRLLPTYLVLNVLVSLSFLLTLKPGQCLAIYRAMIANVVRLPATRRKRRVVQERVRVVPDSAFLPRVTGHIAVRDALKYFIYLLTYNWNRYAPGEVVTSPGSRSSLARWMSSRFRSRTIRRSP